MNFLLRLALPQPVKHWTLTTLREKPIAKVVRCAWNVMFQMAEVAPPRDLFATRIEVYSRHVPEPRVAGRVANGTGCRRDMRVIIYSGKETGMMQQVAQYSAVGLVAGLVLASVGCASPSSSSTRIRMETLCSAGLDEWREIRLTYDRLREREAGEPERAYEQLRVVVTPRRQLRFEQTVKTVELKFGVPRGQCRFENLEARRDETGQKIWFVQRDTSRIVATLDLETRETTGPDDEPPSWATPDGGEPLESAAE